MERGEADGERKAGEKERRKEEVMERGEGWRD